MCGRWWPCVQVTKVGGSAADRGLSGSAQLTVCGRFFFLVERCEKIAAGLDVRITWHPTTGQLADGALIATFLTDPPPGVTRLFTCNKHTENGFNHIQTFQGGTERHIVAAPNEPWICKWVHRVRRQLRVVLTVRQLSDESATFGDQRSVSVDRCFFHRLTSYLFRVRPVIDSHPLFDLWNNFTSSSSSDETDGPFPTLRARPDSLPAAVCFLKSHEMMTKSMNQTDRPTSFQPLNWRQWPAAADTQQVGNQVSSCSQTALQPDDSAAPQFNTEKLVSKICFFHENFFLPWRWIFSESSLES